MVVPTYSLLTPHEDTVTYRIPDPRGDTGAYVEVGLYSWELSGASVGEIFDAAFEGREPRDEEHEGVGLRILFTPPTSNYPEPTTAAKNLKEAFETFSTGRSGGSHTYRIRSAVAGELREAARRAAQYAFTYWWALDNHEDFTPDVQRNESYHERKNRLSIIEMVHEDGTVVFTDGHTEAGPYSLDTCEFVLVDEWASPTEKCISEFEDLIDTLCKEHPPEVVRAAYRGVDMSKLKNRPEKTEELKQQEQFEQGLREVGAAADGVGRAIRRSLSMNFSSMDELCEDIRTGGERLRTISGVGEKTEDSLIDALVETGYWEPTK